MGNSCLLWHRLVGGKGLTLGLSDSYNKAMSLPPAIRWVVLGAVATLFVGAVFSPASGQGRRELRVGVGGLPGVLDPATSLDGVVPLIARQVFETLVQFREGTSDIEPALALHWNVSKDGLVWNFRLRDGVRFHDGTLLTAHHVAAVFERHLSQFHPLYPNPPAVWPRLLRGLPGVVKDVRAIDTKTVQITLVLPYAPLLTVLAHPAFGVIHSGSGDAAAGRWLGTGPFRFVETAPGRVVLERHEGYWGAPPRLDRIVFIEVSGENRAETELDAGRLDLWFPDGPPQRRDGVRSVPGWQVGLLALQTEKEPLNRKKVRQAIAAALDPALITAALDRAAVPLQSLLPPGVWGRREGSPILGGDPEGAKRLLAEAGFPNGITGSLLLSQAPDVISQERVGEAIRASLALGGISLQLRSELPEVVAQLSELGDHEWVLTEARVWGGDPHLFLYPLSTSEGATKGPGALNLSFYRNARLDDLLIRASQLAFRPERLRLYHRAQAILADELPWIPLYVRLHWTVVRPNVRGFKLHPSGFHPMDKIWVEPETGGSSR